MSGGSEQNLEPRSVTEVSKVKVIVLGAGVVGVSTAYYLAKAGHQVTVVDRQSGAGLETSFANGGQISAEHVEPWADPAAFKAILTSIGRADAPLAFRIRADLDQWRWGLQFFRNCTTARARRNTERNLKLSFYSRRLLQELRSIIDVDYDLGTGGILEIFEDAKEFEGARRYAEEMKVHGYNKHAVDADGCVEIEHALESIKSKLAGGIFTPDDEYGDALAFSQNIAGVCAELGVEFLYDTSIDKLNTDGGAVSSVDTSKGQLSADAIIVSMGSYSPKLLKPLGMRVPIYPAKGYSVTIPTNGSNSAPNISITDSKHRMVYTRLGDRVRVAGTAEIIGYDTEINEQRARSLLDVTMEQFPGCGDADKAEFWTGLRPLTPDGVPIIGPTKFDNLYLNTGHGTYGWTMACGSGKAITDIIDGKQPEIDMSVYALTRFN